MDKALKHQIVETIGSTYIIELRTKYTGFIGVKRIDLVQHLMGKYGEITETDPKENQEMSNNALDTSMSFDPPKTIWLESQLSVIWPTQKLLTQIQAVYPSNVASTNDSRPRRLSSDRYRN